MKSKIPLHQIDHSLIDIIFKYRNNDLFFDVNEREHDRQTLEQLYQQLHTLSQKILDSRCYLELGKTQNKQSKQLLTDQTTPQERLGMVAYLVRTLTRPVLFITGRNHILVKQEKQARVTLLEEINQKQAQVNIIAPGCRSENIDLQEIHRIKQIIQNIATNGGKWENWRFKLSLKQAEILSQMAANQELILEQESQQIEWEGTTTSTIIRQYPNPGKIKSALKKKSQPVAPP